MVYRYLSITRRSHYRDFQEGRLFNTKRTLLDSKMESEKVETVKLSEPNRRELAKLIENGLHRNQSFHKLSPTELEALLSLLEEVLQHDSTLQRTAKEFSAANVKEVRIKLVQQVSPNDESLTRELEF